MFHFRSFFVLFLSFYLSFFLSFLSFLYFFISLFLYFFIFFLFLYCLCFHFFFLFFIPPPFLTHVQDRSLPDGSFKLVHYAGDVVYNAAGFLDKNTDTLYKDLSRVRACFSLILLPSLGDVSEQQQYSTSVFP
jgi:hypothetical protein